MLWPAVEKNERRARRSGSSDVHSQTWRLDDFVLDTGNAYVQHGQGAYADWSLAREAAVSLRAISFLLTSAMSSGSLDRFFAGPSSKS